MTIQKYYENLFSNSATQFTTLIADTDALKEFIKAHNLSADFDLILSTIEDRPESKLLAYASREYKVALYSCAAANYRLAYSSLRLVFEMALASVYFSAYEIKLRKWLISAEDIVWAPIIDKENGIFANQFIKPFNSNLETIGKQYGVIAETAYRECSEYVHGNYHTQPDITDKIVFNADTSKKWNDLCDSIFMTFLFAFTARYIMFLSQQNRDKIEKILIERLGHLEVVQDIYGKGA
ncbi:MAG: hypothetical protein DI628_01855 [Blastochloris viridis]|uniref:Uncharacterized protein n=1 Tax=Blastochloris viridis TaxID=1079 RepID=A0A6N4RBJ6_BLAVI|nr:MAG: hypothetical protein DI628_01855 [Blastochloris viridis]